MAEPRLCPVCGAEIPADAPEGLCRRCLMKAGLQQPVCLHIRCPHCHSPVELIDDRPLEDVECPSCGSHFSMLNAETGTFSTTSTRNLAHFQLLEQVGVGHFGSVWKARDTKLDRIVAIKVPRRGQVDGSEIEQFLREARAAAQIRHPNIVGVHEVGREDDSVYIVSDYVDGVSLSEWLTGQRLTPREAAALCVKIAEALHQAHQAGVVHRDLKPGNIMMDRRGEPYLTDFGLAKRETGEITMTVDGRILGTPAYMSPEQARGESHKADRRSDVYSMGVILYQLLTGNLPFRGEPRMLVLQILRDEPMSPRRLNSSISRDLETICLKCLEKAPARRYQTAAELLTDLQLFLDGQPILSRPTSRTHRLWRWCCRHPTPAVAAAAAALLIVAAITFMGALVMVLARSRELERSFRIASNHQLARQLLDQAIYECAKGDETQGVLRLTQSLEQAETCEDERLAQHVRTQLAQWMRRVPPVDTALELGSTEGSRITLSPGGTIAVTCSANGTVRRWRMADAESLPGTFTFADGQQCIFVSPDGKMLVVRGPASAVQVWDGDAGKPISPLLEHQNQLVTAAAISPDETILATGTASASVGVWKIGTWQPVGPPRRHHSGWITGIAFHPHGRALVTCSTTALLWDLEKAPQEPTRLAYPGIARTAAFAPDGRYVAIGGDSGVKFWDVERAKLLGTELPLESGGLSLGFSHDGHLLLTGSEHGKISLWDWRQRARVGSLIGQPYHDFAVSADERLYSAGPQGAVTVRSISELSQPLVKKVGPNAGHSCFCLAKRRAVFEFNGFVYIEDLDTGQLVGTSVRQVRDADVTSMFGARIALGPDGTTALIADGQTARFIELGRSAKQIGAEMSHGDDITVVAFSPNGRIVATGSKDKTVRLWGSMTGKPAAKPILRADVPKVLVFSSCGTRLVNATFNHEIGIWSADTGEPIGRSWRTPADVMSLAMSVDRRLVLTGGMDGLVRVWDAGTGKEVGPPLAHEGPVMSIGISPSGERVVTGGWDYVAKVWDFNERRAIGPPLAHPQRVKFVAFDSGDDSAITWCGDGKLRTWTLAEQLKGSREEIILQIEAATGATLEQNGALRALDLESWKSRVARLKALPAISSGQ